MDHKKIAFVYQIAALATATLRMIARSDAERELIRDHFPRLFGEMQAEELESGTGGSNVNYSGRVYDEINRHCARWGISKDRRILLQHLTFFTAPENSMGYGVTDFIEKYLKTAQELKLFTLITKAMQPEPIPRKRRNKIA